MICPSCQTANPEGARFCMNCGTGLAIACPNCNQSLPAGAKFCFNCGHDLVGHNLVGNAQPSEPVATIPAPTPHASLATSLQQFIPKELLAKLELARAGGTLEGERRVVTMLFCDVKGSTAAAGQLDPEEWAELINRAFERMIRPVYQYEGTVARLMGDGLLAFFGAPIAHEDDPQRAILAGLQIIAEIEQYALEARQNWGIDLNVRVGINTGLVVVGAVGSDLRMEYTALGDAINLAARMEQTAQPGTVQVAEQTYKLTAPLFDFDPIESLEVKGKSEPVRAYRVLRPKVEPGRLRGIAGLDAPLIGRDRQMSQLLEAVAGLQDGRGQVISILGEAGLGKSRLLAELRKAIAAEPKLRMQWVEGRSLSYETATPYAPFVDLLTKCLDIQPGLAGEARYAQLKNRIRSLLPGQDEETAPFIATLLGIPPAGEDDERVKYLEPPQLRGLVFGKVSALIERLASIQPLVLVFEDLHWVDPTSLELLESLLPLTDRAPLIVMAAFRPREQDLSWRFHETAHRDYAHRYTAITLEPLKEEESRALLGNLLHIEDLPEKVRRLVLSKAEGNPFFVEEMIRTLLDAGLVVREDGHWRATREIENIAMPDTLIGVITARLDRLDDGARQVAQAAAVIGRDFTYDILAGLIGASEQLESGLAELQRRELVREKSRLPQRTYLFKHVLTQEAAYASNLLSRRRQLHLRVAEILEERQPEQAADISRHFLEARQPRRAAPYLVAAGDRAARAYSSSEAIGYYSRALELLETLDDLQLVTQAYQGLGGMLALTNQIPQALENYHAMLQLAEDRSDASMQVSALNKIGSITALQLGQFREAERYLDKAERLAHEFEVNSGIVEGAIIRCQMCTAEARFDKLVKHMVEVVEISRKYGESGNIAMAMEHIAGSFMFLARFDEAWQKGQEALEVALEVGDREHEAWLRIQTLSYCYLSQGDLDAAQQSALQGVQIAERIGTLGPQIYGNWVLAEIARQRGEYEQALDYGQRSLETALPLEGYMPFMVVQPLGALGSIYLEISRHFKEEVSKFHLRALKLMEDPSGAAGGGTAWADVGLCALALGDQQIAEESFQKGLNQPTMFMLIERPRYLAGSALLALARGQEDQALELVSEARQFAEERKLTYILPWVALVKGQVHARRGELELALAEFERAEAPGLRFKFRPVVWQARAGAAHTLERLGRGQEALAKRQAAQSAIAEIAQLFRDEQLRAGFLKGASEKMEKEGL